MAEQMPQSTVYNPFLAGAMSLAKTLPKVTRRAAPSPTQAFPNVAGVSGYYSSANAIPGNPSDAFAKLGAITTEYGGSTAYEKYHPGIDIANKEGTAIPAFKPGTVTEVVSGKGWTPGTPSFGNYVVIQDDQGNFHRYSHLDNALVKVGQPVTAGETIGLMGGTGSTYGSDPNAPGYHLDYRIFNAAQKYYNPYNYLAGK